MPGVVVLQFFRFSVWKELGVLWVQARVNVHGEKGAARVSMQRVQWCVQLTSLVFWVVTPKTRQGEGLELGDSLRCVGLVLQEMIYEVCL